MMASLGYPNSRSFSTMDSSTHTNSQIISHKPGLIVPLTYDQCLLRHHHSVRIRSIHQSVFGLFCLVTWIKHLFAVVCLQLARAWDALLITDHFVRIDVNMLLIALLVFLLIDQVIKQHQVALSIIFPIFAFSILYSKKSYVAVLLILGAVPPINSNSNLLYFNSNHRSSNLPHSNLRQNRAAHRCPARHCCWLHTTCRGL